jgi:uncharacterized membrane protein (DUF106 family)
MFKVILEIIKFLPDLIRAIKVIRSKVKDIKDKDERREKLKEFNEAFKKALDNKDTSDLERLFKS